MTANGHARRTGVEQIILAAAALPDTFTAADLVCAAWRLDPRRFGLAGHDHPHSARVICEISGLKTSNPLRTGLMERIRPNVYRLTPLGRSEAARLKGTFRPHADRYQQARRVVDHPAIARWRTDPDQPKSWADVLAFLKLAGNARPAGQLARLRGQVEWWIDWCRGQDVTHLTPPRRVSGEPVHVSQLSEALAFLDVLARRFGRALAM